MNRIARILPLMALVVMLGVALASSGLAHRFATPQDQEVALYAASMGLTAEDICGDLEDGTGSCDACRLQASMSLAEPAVSAILLELGLNPADWVAPPALLTSETLASVGLARAPPLV